MFDTDEEVRKAKAKHETITASHDWDDYYLTDELDDEYELVERFEYDTDVDGKSPTVSLDELREVNKANINQLRRN